jgi:hypothetical protein
MTNRFAGADSNTETPAAVSTPTPATHPVLSPPGPKPATPADLYEAGERQTKPASSLVNKVCPHNN